MPIYVYKAEDGEKGCDYCSVSFEIFQRGKAHAVKKCPKCGAGVRKVISTFSKGLSATGFDNRARDQGFHKLKKTDDGKYEKLY